MSSDMANPPLHFESDPALMTPNSTPGNGYNAYPSIYGNMGNQGMNFNHQQTPYQVQNPGTPSTSLPPMHANGGGAYNSQSNNNFPFSYHGDAGSTPQQQQQQQQQPSPGAGGPGSAPTAPLATPSGAQTTDPLDSGTHGQGNHQHSPHSHQSQAHQLTPPQQHPQTPQQQQQQQQPQQQQQQRQAHNAAPSPYQQPSTQANHPGMGNMMQHGHPIYPGDTRYDRLPQQQRYMDPNMQPMMGRSNSRSGDMPWAQPGGMMPDILGGANHAGGAVRTPTGAAPGGRVPVKQNMAGLNMGGMTMNGMAMGGLGAGLGGMPGMPGMNPMADRMGWGGGMVGAPQSPYGPPQHSQPMHQQQFHHGLQAHPYQQQAHMMQQHPQGIPQQAQHMGNHGGGRIGNNNNNLGPAAGGGISKKKAKRPAAPVFKDKNCPKRPRNSYIFFTLMKRDDIKKKHPEFKPTEITKMLGEEWQKLSEAEKESYGTMAENDKKRYQSEMESYDANGGAAAAAAAAAAEAGGQQHNQNHGGSGGHSHNHSHGGGGIPQGGHGADMGDHWRG
ncbi:hypothetical protein BGZ83_009913 [Gryganskiella cystojenkinii]|nr:hypothetical protein BGZ83_009913 [Gryganskiella cystojenkinii]